MLDYDKEIYLVGNINSNFDEFIIKLLRVGLDNIKGIINSDFSFITNILLDLNCDDKGTIKILMRKYSLVVTMVTKALL